MGGGVCVCIKYEILHLFNSVSISIKRVFSSFVPPFLSPLLQFPYFSRRFSFTLMSPLCLLCNRLCHFRCHSLTALLYEWIQSTPIASICHGRLPPYNSFIQITMMSPCNVPNKFNRVLCVGVCSRSIFCLVYFEESQILGKKIKRLPLKLTVCALILRNKLSLQIRLRPTTFVVDD